MLVNKLSVEDARHILRNEGGEITKPQLIVRVISIAIVAALTARAIVEGHATGWHLGLTMAAEYLALLVALPLVYAFMRVPAMRKEVISSLRLLGAGVVIWAACAWFFAQRTGVPWLTRWGGDAATAWAWITQHEMHWPMLGAIIAILFALPGRVRNLVKYGPPFMAVSLGCGMRAAVLFLGVFLLPFVMANPTSLTWVLWSAILLAELLAVIMHWDIQQRLRKLPQANHHDKELPL